MPAIASIVLTDGTSAEPPVWTDKTYNLVSVDGDTWVFSNPGATRIEDRVLVITQKQGTTVNRVKATLAIPYVEDGAVVHTVRFISEVIIPVTASDSEVLNILGNALSLYAFSEQSDYTGAGNVPLREMCRTGQALY